MRHRKKREAAAACACMQLKVYNKCAHMRVVSEGSAVILHEGNGNVGISRGRGGAAS